MLSTNHRTPTLLLSLIAMLLGLGLIASLVHAQSGGSRAPVQIAASPTSNGNHLLFRLWSDGSIDVRLVNPITTQADDWPHSNKASLSFQEGWKAFQVGN